MLPRSSAGPRAAPAEGRPRASRAPQADRPAVQEQVAVASDHEAADPGVERVPLEGCRPTRTRSTIR